MNENAELNGLTEFFVLNGAEEEQVSRDNTIVVIPQNLSSLNHYYEKGIYKVSKWNKMYKLFARTNVNISKSNNQICKDFYSK